MLITAVEIVSKSGNAYLVAAEEYEALQEALAGRHDRHELMDDEASG
ncbi:hypothetical protein GCM10009850_016320 [Nonomuraea monospora]|uniref:Uncharacterized protein n=1 Tax=Nonomuraea monospora TaxID=568818 RepID=A0ABP5P2Z9_9ACTN